MNPFDKILGLFAPDSCLNCGTEGHVLCQDCKDLLPTIPSICYVCGKAARNYKPCTKCISKWQPDHVWIYCEYVGLAKDLVKSYKFNGTRRAAKLMAVNIKDNLPYFNFAPMVTFVPTAPAHRRERGFDHAELLAKEVAKLQKWHCLPMLARQRQTRQLGANREQRKNQLKDAFRVVNPWVFKGKHVLIIDDVVTTGATIEACAKMLKKAGALQVDVLTFAYTPKNN